MSTSKLRIDLSQGIVEAEGSDTFVLAVYADFKDRLTFAEKRQVPPASPASPASPAVNGGEQKKASTTTNGSAKPRKPKKGRDAQVILKDLDLSKGRNGRLKTFYEKYDLKTNYERNLVFVYYMQYELELENITDDHVFTCYRDVGAKIPKALRQSLIDTSSRNGWLDTSDMNSIRVATPGVNHLEHDLAKATGSAE